MMFLRRVQLINVIYRKLLKEVVKMDKIVEKIADHFNSPEMADRVLCVKIREDGWEKLEAASLLKHIRSQSKPSHIEDVDSQNCDCKVVKLYSEGKVEKSCGTSCAPVGTEKKTDSANRIENINREKELKMKVRRAKRKKQDNFLSRKKHQSLEQKSKNTEEEIDNALSTQNGTQEYILNSNKSEKVFERKEIESSLFSSTNDNNALESQSAQNSLASVSGCSHQIDVTDATTTLKDSNTSEDLNSTVIGEHQIHVHSFWLSLNSSFFRSLFYSSGMKETKDKKVIINISESLSKMFMLLLESLYKPDVINNQSIEDLLILMRLAHVYDVERTLKSCQSQLNSSDLTVQICDKVLNMRDHERLQEMDIFIARCEKFLIQFFSPLDFRWNSEELISLSCTALQKVIASDDLLISSENVVFQTVMKWAEVNEVIGESLQPALELVRFRSMTINYLHDMVTRGHPIASTVQSFGNMFEDAVFFNAFSEERRECCDSYLNRETRQLMEEAILFTWTVELRDTIELPDGKKTIIKSDPFWVSGYGLVLQLQLQAVGRQGLYLSIFESDKIDKFFVKLQYSLTSNMLEAEDVLNEVDIFDKEEAGYGYEEFFPLSLEELQEHIKRTPLIITAQVKLLE